MSRTAPEGRSILRSPWLRRLGIVLGLSLLILAILFVWMQRETVFEATRAVERPAWNHVIILLACVLGNIILSGLLFSTLMSRYGRVGLLEMQSVIAAATLLNFLPLRPGLFGRVAYHKSANDIAVRDSVKVVGQAIVLSSIIAAYFVLIVLSARVLEARITYASLAPLPLLVILALIASLRVWMLAAILRYVELLLWALRYHAAFALLGIDLPWHVAMALAAVSIVAMLIPFFSNGLGIREWAVGLIAPLLTDTQLELAVTAELLNRAGELVIVAITGSIGVTIIARRIRRGRVSITEG